MFKKMDYIYAIYKTGSFSKAAEQLFISQPALSIAVRKLEDELGQKLFFRTTGTVELTEAGKAYIDKCEKIRQFEQELTEYFNELDGLLTGELSIGGANISMNYILPDIITAFSAAYPGIRITLRRRLYHLLEAPPGRRSAGLRHRLQQLHRRRLRCKHFIYQPHSAGRAVSICTVS